MKKHPRALSDAGISPARYAELKSICRQYREMRRDIHVGWPDGNSLVKKWRVGAIEKAAEDAGGNEIGAALLKNVTEGKSYAELRPPCGERQFYQMRTALFLKLDDKLWAFERGSGM